MLLIVIEPRIELTLSIELGTEPITGYLAAGRDPEPQRFSGWVELSGAIEQARRQGAAELEETPEPDVATGVDGEAEPAVKTLGGVPGAEGVKWGYGVPSS